MYNIKFDHSSGALTPQALDDVCSELGISFPPQVRQFYLKQNGGSPTPHLFKKDGEFFAVHQFLAIRDRNVQASLESTYRDSRMQEGFPTDLVPIAIDPGGDYYCFSLDPKTLGSIYCFMQDYFDDPARAILLLASDLNSFLAALEEE